jgi:sterol desaturase/sphingolipid hydroxylase (fatty acid hydroxylase superfamily)
MLVVALTMLSILGLVSAAPGVLEASAAQLLADVARAYAAVKQQQEEEAGAEEEGGLPGTAVVAAEAAAVGLAAGLLARVLVSRCCARRVERQSKSVESFCVLAAALVLLCARRRDVAAQLLNPLGFAHGSTWGALLVCKSAALALLDAVVVALVRAACRPAGLPFREARPNVKGLAALEGIDYFYLAVNQVIEFVFMLHVIRFVLASPGGMVVSALGGMGPLNTVVALYLLFVVDDLIYAPAHLLMHWAPLYPYIHKHHHRQIVPKRGYADAGNEHPLEQLVGLGAVWATMQVVGRVCGLHAITILVHFVLYAALALLNHTNMDVSFRFLGFDYSVGAHEMHHRNPSCNMAQYWMGLDRLMGTWRAYTPVKGSSDIANTAPASASKRSVEKED